MKPSSSESRAAVGVVGGGIIGLSIAWRLAQARFKVSLLDQGKAGGEASWAGAGMLAPGGEVDECDELASLALESRRMYPDFVSELEECCRVPIDFKPCGALDVAYSEAEMEALEARAERQAAVGIQSKRITTNHVSAFWPRVRHEGLVGARFYPKDAVVNPRELTHALKQVCRRQHVEICEHCRVAGLTIESDGVTVQHEHGSTKCEFAIVAAGAWSSEIELSGAPPLPKSEPVKGQLVGYQQPEQTCNTIIRHGHTYLLQRGNGLLIAGSSMERVGFDRELNPFIESDIESRAGFLMPHLAETTKSASWMGFRPASDILHIGAWHSPRLLLAYGHFRNGILLAPVTAERIANELSASWRTL